MSLVPSIIQGIADDLLTSFKVGTRRLKTENGSSAYDEGRLFRAFYDFTGAIFPLVIKVTATKNINLLAAAQEVHDGAMRYRVYSGGVEGGTFTPIPVIPVNLKDNIEIQPSGTTLAVGGTLDTTGETPTDIAYVRTSGASGQTTTVENATNSTRGFPPTTVYVVIDQIPGGNNPPSGVVRYEWTVDD